MIRFLASKAGETHRLPMFLYNKRCALSYRHFKKLVREGWKVRRADHFILRPVYRQRFGWPLLRMVNLPLLRELANGAEILLQKR